MERLTKKYVKVLHKPIITNTKLDNFLERYFVEGNHLYHKGYDYIDEKVEYGDLGEIVAMSDNKEDLIKLQKYTRIEKSKLNEMNAYITEHKKIEQELGIELNILFKAIIFNEDIWCVNEDDKHIFCTENECALNKDENGYYLHIDHIGIYYLKDYGKTWALTKEELEK